MMLATAVDWTIVISALVAARFFCVLLAVATASLISVATDAVCRRVVLVAVAAVCVCAA